MHRAREAVLVPLQSLFLPTTPDSLPRHPTPPNIDSVSALAILSEVAAVVCAKKKVPYAQQSHHQNLR